MLQRREDIKGIKGFRRLRGIECKNILLCGCGFFASGEFLTLIQLPVGWSFLAWVSLVPFVLVCF